jgi:uncharacterized membrane protein
MNDIAIALALHVLSIVIWIGGVSFVTTVVLPALRSGALGADRLRAFSAVESRFVWQARTAILIVGASGLYLLWRLDLWGSFTASGFWWMDAMVGLWLLFAILLFVAEPFVIDRIFHRWAETEPERAFAFLHRAHWVLLTLSVITVLGAMAGSAGW